MKPLYLLAPGQIVTWLSIYDHQFEPIREDFTLIPNQSLVSTCLPTASAYELSLILLLYYLCCSMAPVTDEMNIAFKKDQSETD